MLGVLLYLEHPELPPCSDCKQFVYNPKTWKRLKQGGKDVLRLPMAATPCWQCPKIPQGVDPKPENASELSEKNLQAYEHYLQCKAVGRFPEDVIVEQNAGLIRAAEDQHERNRHKVNEAYLKALYYGR